MSTWRKVGCCLAMVAGVALGAFGYDDELVTIDDDSVVVKANEDGSSVYIFTNTAASATITTRTTTIPRPKSSEPQRSLIPLRF